jgi:hypothetical protein
VESPARSVGGGAGGATYVFLNGMKKFAWQGVIEKNDSTNVKWTNRRTMTRWNVKWMK